MNKKLNAAVNFLYVAATFFYFLLQNGYVVLPGTTDTSGLYTSFTEGFKETLEVLAIVMCVLGIGVVVYDFILQKKSTGVNKVGLIMALVVNAFSAVCFIILGNAPITCVIGVVAVVLILLPGQE